jgi:hypothetical protein
MYYFRGKWKRSKYDKMCAETSWGEALLHFFMCVVTCGLWVFAMLIYGAVKDFQKQKPQASGNVVIEGDIDLSKFYPGEKKKESKKAKTLRRI